MNADAAHDGQLSLLARIDRLLQIRCETPAAYALIDYDRLADDLLLVLNDTGFPAQDITVRMDEASADVLAGRVRLSVNGVALDPARPVPLGALVILPAATAPMTLTVDAAPAGKHTATLRFLATRGLDDDAGKLPSRSRARTRSCGRSSAAWPRRSTTF